MTFKVLQQVRCFVSATFPKIGTKLDMDILAAIGAAEEDGHPLKVKQLVLLGIGAAATVRRRLAWLIECGYIRKVGVEGDGRVAVLLVNPRLKKQFANLGAQLKLGSEPSKRGPQGRD